MVFEVIWDGLFDGRMEDKDHVIGIYLEHNKAVKDSVPADQLLVFESSQGWAPLCTFLDAPLPAEPYPRVNTTEDFAKIMQAHQAAQSSD